MIQGLGGQRLMIKNCTKCGYFESPPEEVLSLEDDGQFLRDTPRPKHFGKTESLIWMKLGPQLQRFARRIGK